MAKGQFRITVTQLTDMVDAFLTLHQESMDAARASGDTSGIIPATRATFCRYWQANGNEVQRRITSSMVKHWVNDGEESYKDYASQIARIDDAGAAYFETIALINPKLSQLAQYGSKQDCYGGYKDKPDNNININIANRGARVNWGK